MTLIQWYGPMRESSNGAEVLILGLAFSLFSIKLHKLTFCDFSFLYVLVVPLVQCCCICSSVNHQLDHSSLANRMLVILVHFGVYSYRTLSLLPVESSMW